MRHLVLLSGLGSSVPFLAPWFKGWANKLEKRLAYSPGQGIIVWNLSADGAGEKPALSAILNDPRLGGVILVGHSNGARDILFMAEVLYRTGIAVKYAACLDMTLAEYGAKACGNIEFLDEFHARLERVDFDESFVKNPANYKLWEVKGGHISMASSPAVQNRLFTKITEIFGPGTAAR